MTLIYQNGYRASSLADVADHSGIPAGNIYYWFKTKDELACAVIETHRKAQQEQFAECERQSVLPATRVRSYLEGLATQADVVTKYGCPLGGLCQELHKSGGDIATAADRLLEDQVSWFRKNFREMREPDVEGLARHFAVAIQGGALLAGTMQDPRVWLGEVSRLTAIIDTYID